MSLLDRFFPKPRPPLRTLRLRSQSGELQVDGRVSAAGQVALTREAREPITVWDLGHVTARLRLDPHSRRPVTALALTRSGAHALACTDETAPGQAGEQAALHLFETATGWRGARVVVDEADAVVSALALRPDARHALLGSARHARLYDLESGAMLRVLGPFESAVGAVALSHDSQVLAVGLHGVGVHLYDASTGHRFAIRAFPKKAQVTTLALDPRSRRLAVGLSTGAVAVVGVSDGALLHRCGFPFRAHRSPISALAFSDGGGLLASGTASTRGRPPAIRVWDVASGKLRDVFEGHPGGVDSLSFSPFVPSLFSCGADGTVREWSLTAGELRDLPELRTPAIGARFPRAG